MSNLPDWLSKVAKPASPSSPASNTLPDWLSGKTRLPEPGMSQSGQLPDWLGRVAQPAEHPQTSVSFTSDTGASDTPDWLDDSPPDSLEESFDQASGIDTDMPDWMSSPVEESRPVSPQQVEVSEDDVLDWLSESAPSTPEVSEQPISQVADDMPDWLSESAPSTPEVSEQPVPQVADDVPDWLSESTGDSSSSDTPQASDEPEAMPDWLAGPDDSGPSPIAETETPTADQEIPDWLQATESESASPTPVPDQPADEVPDWLSESVTEEVTVSESAQAPMTDQDEMPDWLQEGASDIASPSSAPEASSTDEVPDWLTQDVPTSSETETPPEQKKVDADIPDWLTESSAPVAESEVSSATADDVPDWLTESAPSVPVDTVKPEPGTPGGDIPDWLDEVESSAEPSDALSDIFADLPDAPVAEGAAPAVADEADDSALADIFSDLPDMPTTPTSTDTAIPDWLDETPATTTEASDDALQDIFADLPDTPTEPITDTAEPSDALSDIFADLPDVPAAEGVAPVAVDETDDSALADIFSDLPDMPVTEATDVVSAGQPTPAPAEDSVPDWLADTISEPVPAPQTTSDDSLPDFLTMLDTPAEESTPPAPPSGLDDILSAPAEPVSGEDLFGELDMSMAVEGEADLIGLSGGIVGFEDVESEEDISSSEIAAILESIEDEDSDAPAAPRRVDPTLAEQISDLKFDNILEGPTEDKRAEQVGALKNVTGVIQPELIFDGSSLQIDEIIEGTVITERQAEQIAIIEKLLGSSEEETTSKQRNLWAVTRILVSVVIIAVVALPTLLDYTLLTSPRPGLDTEVAYELVDGLPDDAKVVIAFEYEADFASELDPLAEALLSHLEQHEQISIFAITTQTIGPALINQAFGPYAEEHSLLPENDEGNNEIDITDLWINLGYLPGGDVGIRSLVIGTAADIPSGLSETYQEVPVELGSNSLLELQPDLIIILASRNEDLKDWLEQTNNRLETPIIAGLSASAYPLAGPYRDSEQLVAVLSGINDAVAYTELGNDPLSPSTRRIWNAQAFGGIAVTIMVVLGAIVFSLQSSRGENTQGL